MHRCCEDPEDEEYRDYQPAFVEAYLQSRYGPEQSIEEWHDAEGGYMFHTDEIHRPVSLAVSLSGSEPNEFLVNTGIGDWHSKLEDAVRSALEKGGHVKVGDKVALENVRGESLSGLSRDQLEKQGQIYAVVNGKRTVETQRSKQAGLGCVMRTPLQYSPLKESMLVDYTKDLFERAQELIIAELASCQNMVELDARVAAENEKGIKHAVATLIERDAGTCKDLGTFDNLVKTYAEPLALEALRRGHLTTRIIAEKMASRIVDEVASCMQSKGEHVQQFYQAQELLAAKRLAPPGKGRTIFANDSFMAKTAASIGEILKTYPTATKLHRTVVANALDANEGLRRSVIAVIANAIPPEERQRVASRYAAIGPYWEDKQGHRHHGHHGGNGHRQHGRDGMHRSHRDGMHGDHARAHRDGMRHQHRSDGTAYRHVEGLVETEAVAAQIRTYIASGFVPPQFEPYDQSAKLQRQIAAEPPSRVASTVTGTAAAAAPARSQTSTIFIPEPASLEPIRQEVKADKRRGPPPLEDIPASKINAVLSAEPPSLEPIPVGIASATMQEPPSLEPIDNREPPSLEPIPVTQRKVAAALSPVRTASKPPAPVRSVAVAATVAKHKNSPPPAIKYVQKSVAAPVTRMGPDIATHGNDDADGEEESLPSLEGLVQLASKPATVIAIKSK